MEGAGSEGEEELERELEVWRWLHDEHGCASVYGADGEAYAMFTILAAPRVAQVTYAAASPPPPRACCY